MNPSSTQPRTALIAGASGLTGSFCLHLLLKDAAYSKVIAVVRKKLPVIHDKLRQEVVDFDNLAQYKNTLKADDVFCCLGTTIKKAGSQEVFRQVDYHYPLELAKLTCENGAKQFLMITAMGADARSLIFYNKVKGEVEEAIVKLPFKSVHILRPSLLLGEREESRPGEKVGEKVMKSVEFVLQGPLKKYRAIEAEVVADTMVEIAKKNVTGINVYQSDKIQGIYDRKMRRE